MSDSETAAETARGYGLDKNSRLEAKRAEDKEEDRVEPLDPPFPYRVIAFDPSMVSRGGI